MNEVVGCRDRLYKQSFFTSTQTNIKQLMYQMQLNNKKFIFYLSQLLTDTSIE